MYIYILTLRLQGTSYNRQMIYWYLFITIAPGSFTNF